MAGGKVPLTFRLYKGDEFLREEKLTLPVIKVGKLSSSHLRLDDKNVSRMHALIEVTGPGDVSIIDLSSTTGTFTYNVSPPSGLPTIDPAYNLPAMSGTKAIQRQSF